MKNKVGRPKIITHETVIDYFKKHHCQLLSRYNNIKSPIEYKCSCGRKEITSFESFSKSKYHKCKKCCVQEANKTRAYNLQYLKKIFKSMNCELLENEYTNSRQELKFKC